MEGWEGGWLTIHQPVGRQAGRTRVVEVGGGSLNFDYAHFLPGSSKCGVLHGHTASVKVGVRGDLVGDMVLEFGELKELTKTVIASMDHKLILCRKYVEKITDGRALIRFHGIGGEYVLELPLTSAYIMDEESTAENISAHIAGRLMELMPGNVGRVYVRMSEGLGKWSISML
jgi:6-pyruvoyltetrahydropterin/6-carboxytetrahydropterin synthase